ncbi:calcium-binding protein [Aestuariivirga sp.]|uniref:calcium-binding protein n=1 Tax=Aestuariivirga sp. TaxID=2650926 RepID=UPI00359451A2
MSRATGRTQANGFSGGAAVADDGTVAYISQATNLTPNDTKNQGDAFVTQFKNGVFTTTVLSVDSNGELFTSRNQTTHVDISSNGKVVAFGTDTDDDLHPEVSICRFEETDGLSLPTSYEGSGESGVPDLSGSGSLCTFNSTSDDLGPIDSNGTGDVYAETDGWCTEKADIYRLLDCSEYLTTIGESVDAGGGDDRVFGTGCDEIIRGGGADTINCRGGADTCSGGTGADRIDAGAGIDRVRGGGGNDILIGGLDADYLWGDVGVDRFSYRDIGESLGGTKIDRIFDFELGVDIIGLSKIDADTSTLADDAFVSIGTGAFSGTVGELRQVFAGKNAIVQGDVDGDGIKDFCILVLKTDGQLIGGFSFVL